MGLSSHSRHCRSSPRGDSNVRICSVKEVLHVHPRSSQRPPPRDRSTKRVQLTDLWTVLPGATRQKTLLCLARIVVDHLERKEVRDDPR
jgi:hypothetical protein